MSYISRMIGPIIKRFVAERLPKEIEKILPGIIDDSLRKIFASQPSRRLNEVGFNWALALSLTDIWPGVSKKEAICWLREYIDAPFGHQDYEWSAAAAKIVAQEYVNDLGED